MAPELEGSGEDCPVCFDAFTDPLPRPDQIRSRAPSWLFACDKHAMCIDCDESVETHAGGNANALRCPLCRSARAVWVQRH